ncbi:MAG: hypothetical protein ABWZ86_03065 [Hyphomicrobium sp.]
MFEELGKMKIRTAVAVFSVAMLWANDAFAFCLFFCGPPSPGPSAAPEIDGPGSLAAVALLMSVGAIVYRKLKQ